MRECTYSYNLSGSRHHNQEEAFDDFIEMLDKFSIPYSIEYEEEEEHIDIDDEYSFNYDYLFAHVTFDGDKYNQVMCA